MLLNDLQRIGTLIVSELAIELAKKDKKASGKLLKSIRSEVGATASGFEIAVYALDYFKFVDRGVNGRQRNRGSQYSFKNKKPPLQPLLEWVKQRSLASGDKESLKAAYAIQNHVWKNGVEGINFLDEFIEKKLDSQLSNIGDALAKDVMAKIDKVI